MEISFPPLEDDDGKEGPMIIEAEIGGHLIHRIYVDGGSTSEILYKHYFNRLHPEVKSQMIPATTPPIGFSGEIIWPMGQILLPVKIRDAKHFNSTWMNFVVVRSPSPYNRIIRRPGVRKIQAVTSTAHKMLKFLVSGGILTLRSSRIIPLECIMVSRPEARPSDIIHAAEERIKVAIHPEHPEQTITIGSTLTKEGQKALCDLLRRSLDVFAWKPADITGVPRHIAEYRLNVREGCSPVRQKKRSQAPERNKAIQEEVEKLVDAGIMKEVHYHSWLSNPVMVKKHDDSWRMCVDFKDLNKACPKDGYPLPEIDWKVKSLCGHPFKCSLDAYKGYNQIKMAKEGEEKTTFIISQGVFCYSKIPFGLKNVRATYQRLVDKALQKQLAVQKHLAETWKQSRSYFKPAIPKMSKRRTQVEWKASKSKQIPFQISRKATFKEMKKLIVELPTLTAPMEKEELIVYLAAAREAYRPRTSVKGQILADFIVERPKDDSLDTPIEAEEELSDPWTLFTDRSSCIDGSGAGLILTNPEGAEFTYALRFSCGGKKRLTPIYNNLTKETLLGEKEKARAVRHKARRYTAINGHACQNKICGSKGHTDRILLADNACGCKKIDKSVSRLPVSPPRAKKSAAKIDSHHANGLVERANRILGEGIKTRIDERSKDWIEELPYVLWAHPKVDMVQNDEALGINLDLLEERKEQAAIREANIKAKMEKYYNSKVRNTNFKPGDLVYRSNEASHAKESGNLSPKWEGPYEVTKALGNGAYKLSGHNGKLLPQTWNVCSLKRCYIHEV
ncbi:reverse transcriptase domain-containing protein [Tanacetum coccineum]